MQNHGWCLMKSSEYLHACCNFNELSYGDYNNSHLSVLVWCDLSVHLVSVEQPCNDASQNVGKPLQSFLNTVWISIKYCGRCFCVPHQVYWVNQLKWMLCIFTVGCTFLYFVFFQKETQNLYILFSILNRIINVILKEQFIKAFI
jgi:hypothetical protein